MQESLHRNAHTWTCSRNAMEPVTEYGHFSILAFKEWRSFVKCQKRPARMVFPFSINRFSLSADSDRLCEQPKIRTNDYWIKHLTYWSLYSAVLFRVESAIRSARLTTHLWFQLIEAYPVWKIVNWRDKECLVYFFSVKSFSRKNSWNVSLLLPFRKYFF